MIDKQSFYHGAALMAILESVDCKLISKFDNGFLVNKEIFIFLKYTTKSRSPWRFSFSEDEVDRLKKKRDQIGKVYVGLICGGDGICVLDFEEVSLLVQKSGWISVKRNFHEQYAVSGSESELKHKISFKRWPQIIF